MIKVQIKRNNKYITQIIIKGHDKFVEYGKYLVCSVVSAVATGICNTLAKKGFLEEKKCAIILKNGNIMIDVYENDEIMQVILETLVISLESFTEDYHQYIKITYEEE